MKKITLLLIVLILTACNFTAGPVSISIGATNTPVPTATAVPTSTPLPTSTLAPTTIPPTPTLMPTDTPAPQVGIEVPVVVYGVDLQFYKIVEIPSFEANGETYYPNPGYIMIDVFADNKNGKSYTVANWPMDPSLGAVTVTTSSGLQVLWSFSNYMLNPGDAGNVDWIFAIPEGEVVVAINLPGGIVVDLTSLLGQFQSQNG